MNIYPVITYIVRPDGNFALVSQQLLLDISLSYGGTTHIQSLQKPLENKFKPLKFGNHAELKAFVFFPPLVLKPPQMRKMQVHQPLKTQRAFLEEATKQRSEERLNTTVPREDYLN